MSFISSMIFSLVLGLFINHMAIQFGHRFKFLDIPSSRRRHQQPTPIIGGVGVFISWLLGLGFYAIQSPDLFSEHSRSIEVILSGTLILVILGLWDDLKGLSPYVKLFVEIFVAIFTLLLEPNVNFIMNHWAAMLGPLVWVLGVIWIVGIINAINLIDGMDGLAGGMSLLVASSIFIMSLWTGHEAVVCTALIGILIPILMAFLKYNWSPAKIFLGDNGSLPLGFILGTGALMCRPESKSWIMVASIILMLGYPVLDMGQSVLRRRKNHLPLFKADRVHLHYRVMRLGLSVPQTATLLLSIGFYLQISALAVNLLSPPAAVLGISVVVFSICTLLFLIYSIEKWRVKRTFDQVRRFRKDKKTSYIRNCIVMKIDISPLLEANSYEQRGLSSDIISALELMFFSILRKEDRVMVEETKLVVIFQDLNIEDEIQIAQMKQKYEQKLVQFINLFNLAGSLSTLPISFSKQRMVVSGETGEYLSSVA